MTHDCDRSTSEGREDPKLLVGEAKYVDDIQVPGQLWMGMVRSPMAHAKIASIDTSEAETHEGVHAVYTGPQLQEMGLWIAPLPCAWPVTDDMVNPPHYPLAMDEVHHVGEIVAIVLADSRYGAVDAAELVVVDYEPLDAVASMRPPATAARWPTRISTPTSRSTGRSYPTLMRSRQRLRTQRTPSKPSSCSSA